MFENCRNPIEAAYIYRRFGFPIALHYGYLAVITTPHRNAIAIPPQLARCVAASLQDRPQVPIIAHPRPGRDWIFLVDAHITRTYDLELLATLRRHHVTMLAPGRKVWLPTSDSHHSWYWVSEPTDAATPLPSRHTVIQAITHAIGTPPAATPAVRS